MAGSSPMSLAGGAIVGSARWACTLPPYKHSRSWKNLSSLLLLMDAIKIAIRVTWRQAEGRAPECGGPGVPPYIP